MRSLKTLLIFLAIMVCSCGLDPENPEDAQTIMDLISLGTKIDATFTNKVKIAVNLRSSALSSDAFDKTEIGISKLKDGTATIKLILHYAKCFEDRQTLERKQLAFRRLFGNFSLLDAKEASQTPEGQEYFILKRSDTPIGAVSYENDETYVLFPTNKIYDEYVKQSAVEPGRNHEVHQFNFENILNEAFEGYCYFQPIYPKKSSAIEKVPDGRIFEVSYSTLRADSEGDCGNYLNNEFIPKSTALAAFLDHKMYTLMESESKPNLYQILNTNGWKVGMLDFYKDTLAFISTVKEMEYVSGMANE